MYKNSQNYEFKKGKYIFLKKVPSYYDQTTIIKMAFYTVLKKRMGDPQSKYTFIKQ